MKLLGTTRALIPGGARCSLSRSGSCGNPGRQSHDRNRAASHIDRIEHHLLVEVRRWKHRSLDTDARVKFIEMSDIVSRWSGHSPNRKNMISISSSPRFNMIRFESTC